MLEFWSTNRFARSLVSDWWRPGTNGVVGWLEAIKPTLAAIRRTIGNVDRRTERIIAVATVAALHCVFALVLIAGARLPELRPTEVSLRLVGGPLGEQQEQAKPLELIKPESDILPPTIDIATSNTAMESRSFAHGSPNVTRPAMAVAEAHAFPVLPLAYVNNKAAMVRLILSIAKDGSITAAQVAQTSGASALDQIAVDWVRAHWRYQPALQNGEAVPVTTMAVVTFLRA